MKTDEMIKLAGEMLNENYDAALDLYRQAADAGNVDAMIELMRHYDADEFSEGAAEMAERIVEVADAYRSENNLDKAVELYEEVAALDFKTGIQRLEEISADFVGLALEVDKRGDFQKSFQLYLRAAELKNPTAMAMTARMYELGIGVAQNISAALKWYVEAANAGEPHARQRIEMLFNEGR